MTYYFVIQNADQKCLSPSSQTGSYYRSREENQEDSTKLRKQIKGQINRLTGTNIHTVAAQVR